MSDVKVRIEIRVKIRKGAEIYQMKIKSKKKYKKMVPECINYA
jgi:hypothetical protein